MDRELLERQMAVSTLCRRIRLFTWRVNSSCGPRVESVSWTCQPVGKQVAAACTAHWNYRRVLQKDCLRVVQVRIPLFVGFPRRNTTL